MACMKAAFACSYGHLHQMCKHIVGSWKVQNPSLVLLLQVDGVFDCDPETHPEAILHRELTYRDVIAHNLRVMDETAITICKENNIPVRVFNIARPGNIMRALAGDSTVGTIVSEACPDLPCRTLPEAELS